MNCLSKIQLNPVCSLVWTFFWIHSPNTLADLSVSFPMQWSRIFCVFLFSSSLRLSLCCLSLCAVSVGCSWTACETGRVQSQADRMHDLRRMFDWFTAWERTSILIHVCVYKLLLPVWTASKAEYLLFSFSCIVMCFRSTKVEPLCFTDGRPGAKQCLAALRIVQCSFFCFF